MDTHQKMITDFQLFMTVKYQHREILIQQHTLLKQAMQKLYIYKPGPKIHSVYVEKQQYNKVHRAYAYDIPMSRGVLYNLLEGPTPMDLVHLHIMQAIYDTNEKYPMPRLVCKADIICCEKDALDLKKLKTKKPFSWSFKTGDFLVLIIMGIPTLYVMYILHTMDPFNFTFFEKLLIRMHMIFFKMFPNVKFPGLDL